MNRLIKVILCITAGCIGVGCASLILGFALGGMEEGRALLNEMASQRIGYAASSFADRVKNRIDGRVWDSSCETDNIELAEVYEGEAETSWDDSYELQKEYALEEADEWTDYGMQQVLAIEAQAIQAIQVNLQHAYLAIEESDDSCIQVAVSQPDSDVRAQVNDGKLVISDGRKGRKARKDIYVYLYIPEDVTFDSVSIENEAGVVEMDCELETGNFSAQSGAGQMILSDITADVFSATAGAGEINIEDGIFKTVQLECGVGSVYVDADIQGSAQIDCGMGVVSLDLDNDPDSVNYLLKCGAGVINIDDDSYSGFSSEKRIDNGASELFTLSCGMGQIIIE